MNRIDPDFSPSGFQKLIKPLNRNESTLINRLRSNHLPLNVFLHRIQRGESPTCSKCNNADETIRHYLFECAAYRQIRRETLDGLGRNSRDTSVPAIHEEGDRGSPEVSEGDEEDGAGRASWYRMTESWTIGETRLLPDTCGRRPNPTSTRTTDRPQPPPLPSTANGRTTFPAKKAPSVCPKVSLSSVVQMLTHHVH